MSLALALRMGPWLAILILIGALAVQTDRVGDWKERTTVCQNLRTAEHEAYRAAQSEAAAKNREHVSKIETEQRTKTDEVERSYRAELARLRANGVRLKADTAAKGAAGQSGASAVPVATSGPDGTADVCVPRARALQGAESELRLIYLQEWIRGQLKIAR